MVIVQFKSFKESASFLWTKAVLLITAKVYDQLVRGWAGSSSRNDMLHTAKHSHSGRLPEALRVQAVLNSLPEEANLLGLHSLKRIKDLVQSLFFVLQHQFQCYFSVLSLIGRIFQHQIQLYCTRLLLPVLVHSESFCTSFFSWQSTHLFRVQASKATLKCHYFHSSWNVPKVEATRQISTSLNEGNFNLQQNFVYLFIQFVSVRKLLILLPWYKVAGCVKAGCMVQ